MGSEELVGRAGQEVRAEGREVDRTRGARGGRRRRRSAPRRRARGPRSPGRRASCRGGWTPPVNATSLVRSPSTASTRRRVELAGRGVEVDPADGGPDRLGGQHPRAHVGVVVEPGDDDLVARAPALGQGAGEVHGQLGHRPSEDDPGRVGGEQVADGRPGRDDGCLGVALGGRRVAAVGQGRDQHVVHRLGHDVGRLRAARPVEVGRAGAGPLLQLREVGSHPGDVVRVTLGRLVGPSEAPAGPSRSPIR